MSNLIYFIVAVAVVFFIAVVYFSFEAQRRISGRPVNWHEPREVFCLLNNAYGVSTAAGATE